MGKKAHKRITIAVLSAALLLSAVLWCAPTQGHYITRAQWQAPYAAAFGSNLLTPAVSQYRLEERSPEGDVQLNFTIRLYFDAGVGAGGSAVNRTVTMTAISNNNSCLTVDHPSGTYTLHGNATTVVSISATAHPVESAAEPVLSVEAVCEGQVLRAQFVIPLSPAADEPEGTPVSASLFGAVHNETLVWEDPFLLTYTASQDGELTYQGGKFPRMTRYDADGSGVFTTLYEDSAIPLRAGQHHVLLDLSAVVSRPRTVRFDIHTPQQTDRLSVTSMEALPRTENTLPSGSATVYVPVLHEEGVSVSTAVSRLVRAADEEGEPVISWQAAEQFTYQWGQMQEDGGHYLQLDPTEGQKVPSGSYRLTVIWELNGEEILRRQIPFFVYTAD